MDPMLRPETAAAWHKSGKEVTPAADDGLGIPNNQSQLEFLTSHAHDLHTQMRTQALHFAHPYPLTFAGCTHQHMSTE